MSRMLAGFLVALGFAVAACGSSGGGSTGTTSPTPIESKDGSSSAAPSNGNADSPIAGYVVFEGATGDELVTDVLGRPPSTVFPPDEAAVDGLLAALPAAAEGHELSHPLGDYRAQITGIGEGTGRRIIGSFFCDDLGVDWKTTPVVVADGGDCYFQVSYTPDLDEITSFFINAEA